MVYLNHAGTSWPKPPEVLEASAEALASEPGRWGEVFERAHAATCRALGVVEAPERLLLTSGCTASLASLMTALPWSTGDRLVVSCMEHHALSRWAVHLSKARGVAYSVIPRATRGPMDLDALEDVLKGGDVRWVAHTMASNVTGEVLPVADTVALARRYGARVLLDAAQVAGVMGLDVEALGADALVFAGHKGPQGPQGIGGLYVAPGVFLDVPMASCDVLGGATGGACGGALGFCDVGSVNVAGAAGLAAGWAWLEQRGVSTLEATSGLARRLRAGLDAIEGVEVVARSSAAPKMPVVSVVMEGAELGAVARGLEAYGVVARAGFHCAPMAHEALGTAEAGTLRLSLGPRSSAEDVERALEAMRAVVVGGG